MKLKRILLSISAFFCMLASIPFFAAYEAHVINVTARIESALSVPLEEISYGTTFPQERMNKQIDISLSGSFLNEDRVDSVVYSIKRNPKCAITWNNGQEFDGLNTVTGIVKLDQEHHAYIDCGPTPRELGVGETWGVLPSLCEYFSIEKIDKDVGQHEYRDQAFHEPYIVTGPPLTGSYHLIWYEAQGELFKSQNDIFDTWSLNLKTPCFSGHCAQDWEQFIKEDDYTLNPDDFIQPAQNEHKIFGCDVWIEVASITENKRTDLNFFEDFEDTSGFTIGGGGALYWNTAPLGGTASFPTEFLQGSSSQSGLIFYGSAAKEYAGAPAATVMIPLPDLSEYTDLKLTVALAALDRNVWENTHRDSFHIIGSTTTSPVLIGCLNAGCMPIDGAIDNFLPTARGGNLKSQVHSIELRLQFSDFHYNIDNNLKSIVFAFASTAQEEYIGIDSVRITGRRLNP